LNHGNVIVVWDARSITALSLAFVPGSGYKVAMVPKEEGTTLEEAVVVDGSDMMLNCVKMSWEVMKEGFCYILCSCGILIRRNRKV
jgi:hypothetical protein